MNPTPHLKAGDKVLLTCNGRTVPAMVQMASSNGRSIFLSFEAMLVGWVAQMAVLWEKDGWHEIINGVEVKIELVP